MPVNPLGKLIIQGVLSLGLVGAGLFVLITVDLKANTDLAVAAGGWIALPVGYWMK